MAKVLKKGGHGNEVKTLQKNLKEAVPKTKLKPDGDFGPATEEALKAFQKDKSLKSTASPAAKRWRCYRRVGEVSVAKRAMEKVGKRTLKA